MNYSIRIHNRLAGLRSDNEARGACFRIAEEADHEIAALRQALLTCARLAEALKRPCGDDPESGQAVRNAQYQAISTLTHQALGAPSSIAAEPLPEWSLALETSERALDRFIYSQEPAALAEADEFRELLRLVLDEAGCK